MGKLAALLGFLVGIAAGILLLLYNPLSPPPESNLIRSGGSEAYRYTPSEVRGMDLSAKGLMNGERLGLVEHDFSSPGISHSIAAVLVLRDANGDYAALATKLAAFSADSSVLRGDVGINSYWNIFWPNRGSVFLAGYENRWPMIRDRFVAAIRGDVPGPGSQEYILTAKSDRHEAARAFGGSGRYRDTKGTFQESEQRPDADSETEGSVALAISAN